MTDTPSPTPLDRPIWHSLTGRQAALALGDARAVRFRPEVNLFGEAADDSPEASRALVGLIKDGGTLGLLGVGAAAALPGTVVVSERRLNQMVATRLHRTSHALDIVPLGDADAAEMLALATLTAPGPFFAATHLQGGYIGVRRGGRLVAMAGERMRYRGSARSARYARIPTIAGRASRGR